MWTWVQDVTYAVRAVSRARSFAASAIGTMTVAIAAVVTIFTVGDRVLLRPLPSEGSARVSRLCETSPSTGSPCTAPPLNLEDLARDLTDIEAAGVPAPNHSPPR